MECLLPRSRYRSAPGRGKVRISRSHRMRYVLSSRRVTRYSTRTSASTPSTMLMTVAQGFSQVNKRTYTRSWSSIAGTTATARWNTFFISFSVLRFRGEHPVNRSSQAGWTDRRLAPRDCNGDAHKDPNADHGEDAENDHDHGHFRGSSFLHYNTFSSCVKCCTIELLRIRTLPVRFDAQKDTARNGTRDMANIPPPPSFFLKGVFTEKATLKRLKFL